MKICNLCSIPSFDNTLKKVAEKLGIGILKDYPEQEDLLCTFLEIQAGFPQLLYKNPIGVIVKETDVFLAYSQEIYTTIPLDITSLQLETFLKKSLLAINQKQKHDLNKTLIELEEQNLKLKSAYERVRNLSKHDYLTQAPNRKYFLEKIEYEQLRFKRNHQTFVLVYADIDNFKKVNDAFGHETGDFILIELTKFIKDTIRDVDFFCRWGGEEFLIYLADADLKIGKLITQRIAQQLKNHNFIYHNKKIKITMTYGIAVYDKHCHIKDLIDLADKRLLWGKNHKKSSIIDSIS